MVSAVAQMLRRVGSGLTFCKQRFRYGHQNSFSTSKFEMVENKVQPHKTPLKYFFRWFFLCVYKVFHGKIAFC